MENNIMFDDTSKNLLERIYQGNKSNIYVLNNLICKTVNENFKSQLEKNRDSLLRIINDCLAISSNLNTNLQDITLLKKAKLKSIIKFNNIVDNSTENSTKTLLTLFNEEIFNIIKALDCNENSSEEIKKLALLYNKTLEKCINDTKKFLIKDPNRFDDILQKKKDNKNENKKKKLKKNKREQINS